MINVDDRIPPFFEFLIGENLVKTDDVLYAKDGFFMIYKSISSILISKGIETFPDREGRILESRNYFDD